MDKKPYNEVDSDEILTTEESSESNETMLVNENLDEALLDNENQEEFESTHEEAGNEKHINTAVEDDNFEDNDELEAQTEEDLIDEYLENADKEEDVPLDSFKLHEFEYTLKNFDIAREDYEQGKDSLDEHGYIFLSNENDLKSKYFADTLLKYIDKFGNLERSELTFCENQNDDSKNDFIDLRNDFLTLLSDELLVLDLCKFGHVQKEYFLNSFYNFIKKDGNKIKFREFLEKRNIKLILITYHCDIEKNEDLFNVYKVKEHSPAAKEEKIEEEKRTDILMTKLLSNETEHTIERALLFLVSLFKGCTPIELQNMLFLILDDEDKIQWKKERKKFLSNVHVVSRSELGTGTVIEFDTSIKGHEFELLGQLRAEDPFFVLEFFDVFEANKELLHEVLSGYKSQNFTDGFFQLIKVVSLDDPDKLSLNWFVNKFETDQNFSIAYFFSLASCALQVSEALNNHIFLNELVSYFYKKKTLKPLLYLLEYFSYVESFDKYKWYKEILFLINDDPNRGKLFSMLYRAIQKDVYSDITTLNVVLSWRNNNKISNAYIFKILTRLASDSVKENRDWSGESISTLPFLFSLEESSAFDSYIEAYFEYLFDFQDILSSCDNDLVLESLSENINKLFFTKIIGLTRLYVNKREQKSIIKNIAGDIQKLVGGFEKTYILYEIILILEWSFSLKFNVDAERERKIKGNIFSVYLDNIRKDELKISRNTIHVLSNILLKLSSQTRKYKPLSSKYIMLRKDLRHITKNMKKTTKKEEN